MIHNTIKKLLGTHSARFIKRLTVIVQKINQLEPEIQALSDSDLRLKTSAFKAQITQGASLDQLLPEAFAVVREASIRTLGMRHFDVQLLGGMVLHQGKIAQMGTGEGKTLVATLAVYLNALAGHGVHVVTVNDYLAKRDAEWMGPLYAFLGLSVGVALCDMQPQQKKLAYQADITYATNNELGFDYLRDHMAFSAEEKVQRGLAYVIVDEVDSVFIDEARTPLIISGPVDENAGLYQKLNRLVTHLVRCDEQEPLGHYTIDEKLKQVYLNEQGHQSVERLLMDNALLKTGESLYDPENISLMHHFNAVMRAHFLYQKDVDYIVKKDAVLIIDEHTGRTMEGRRWSDGLHQAIEAKEGVSIRNESHTLASITFQNYFRMYQKIAGMTGTAETESQEFFEIYGLEVIPIPPNKPLIRKDHSDLVYISKAEKYTAIIAEIKQRHQQGQPILVGTASIETSEQVSGMLKKEKIAHQVLNAKFHEKEALIIAQAGRLGAVTIATNMAGRGTDIVLGGHPTHEKDQHSWKANHDRVIQLGGLHVLGTERNESRRIDNQLRGRSGRQGDPGSSRFYLSLEDNLLRIFASDKVAMLMKRLGMQPGDAIEHALVTRAIENAQKKVESHHFMVRKQLLHYDDVANDQRKVIYQQRDFLIYADDLQETIDGMRQDVVHHMVAQYIPPEVHHEVHDVQGLLNALQVEFHTVLPQDFLDKGHLTFEDYVQKILEVMTLQHQEKRQHYEASIMNSLEKGIMLNSLDIHWKEHLASMDHLRQSIHLRSYAQKDPIQEYKRESFLMFSAMLDRIKYDTVKGLVNSAFRPI